MTNEKAAATPPVAEGKAESLETLVPTITDAPKGEVTLGPNAGAFGPWRAHQVIDGTAKQIAAAARESLAATDEPRVLVVNDRSLLADDWMAHQVRDALTRLSERLERLVRDVDEGLHQLTNAIRHYKEKEDEYEWEMRSRTAARGAVPRAAGPQAAGPQAVGPQAAGPTPAPAATPAGALAAAVDLLGLLRTDYTITATAVSATPSELATLTAAHLAAPPAPADEAEAEDKGVAVEADAFSTMRSSPSTKSFAAVLQVRDHAVLEVWRLQDDLAWVEAELTSIKARVALFEQNWAKAMGEGKDQSITEPLRSALDQLSEQASRRERAAGPARTLVAHAQQVVADVDAAVTAFLVAPEGGQAPLLTTVRRERLDATVTTEKITHVLYVQLDGVAADAVTRRSILGTSGYIRFLSAGNASWLLLEASSGTIAGGGQVSLADVMTFGLENGNAHFEPAGTWLRTSEIGDDDPLRTLERWAKVMVVALVLVLLVVGVFSVLAFLAVVQVTLG
jgi:hypothetical protein